MILKNTDNSAVISIKNNQTAENLNECTEVISEGRFYKSGDKFYIFYSEEESENVSANTVMITAEEKQVTMSRKGEYASKMIYKEGTSDYFTYHTPYGDIQMHLKTEVVENRLTENGGTLRLCYKLGINGDEMDNDLTITVRNEKGD